MDVAYMHMYVYMYVNYSTYMQFVQVLYMYVYIGLSPVLRYLYCTTKTSLTKGWIASAEGKRAIFAPFSVPYCCSVFLQFDLE